MINVSETEATYWEQFNLFEVFWKRMIRSETRWEGRVLVDRKNQTLFTWKIL